MSDMEATLERLVATSENLLKTAQAHESRLQVHDDRFEQMTAAILGLTEIAGIMAQETRQLKRTVDYLLSQDGGQS